MLAQYLKKHHISPEQVQDFYPTPGTVSTTMYYTGLDPFTLEPVFVEHNPHKKAMQRALIQYWKPENYDIVKEALKEAGREDLIGFGEKCLIPPRKMTYTYKLSKSKDKNKKINNKKSNGHKKTR